MPCDKCEDIHLAQFNGQLTKPCECNCHPLETKIKFNSLNTAKNIMWEL